MVLLLLSLLGCIDGGVVQVAGTGALYTTRCSSVMEAHGDAFHATCTPPACADSYDSVAESDVVVAVDPGRKIVGYRERVCVQDLSSASPMFAPQPPEAPEP